MINTTATRPLEGSHLDAFLDEVEACFPDDETQSPPAIASAAAMLHARPCQADDMTRLGRLFNLWWRAGEPRQALMVLDSQQSAVLAALPKAKRQSAELQLLFWRLNALQYEDVDARLSSVLNQTIDTLARLPVTEQPEKAWLHLSDVAHTSGDHDRYRQCLRARHACLAAIEGRKPYRAWDEAMLAARLGESHAATGEADTARSYAESVLRILSTAGGDQEIDHNDWLNLGEIFIPYAPGSFKSLAKQVRRLQAKLAKPQRRATEVRLARLESLALHCKGELKAALAKSRQGRFCLTEDDDDAYSARVLDWLLAAGRNAEAAALAFESCLNERKVAAGHACHTAARQLQAGAVDAHWPLALAFAATTTNYNWVTNGEDIDTFFNRHLELARSFAPKHPALQLLRAMRTMDTREAYAEALPMLERAARHAQLSNADTVRRIWLCRFHLHGVKKALTLPLVKPAAAGWCYNMGVALDHELAYELPEGTAWPEEAVADVAARYYELGRKKYEAFFSSGKGMMRDADAHAYSMLCNNLAIYYRYKEGWKRKKRKNNEAALALHLRGIAASPFAEHYQGVMDCHSNAGRKEEFVASADRLWQFAMEHGYSRHNPAVYVHDLASTLHDLGRGTEIAIWLQRLEDWWARLDVTGQEEHRPRYMGTQASALSQLALSQPTDALTRLEAILPEIRATGLPGPIRVAGKALIYAGEKERALDLFREASQAGDNNDEWDLKQRKYALQDLARFRNSIDGKRPWWRLW